MGRKPNNTKKKKVLQLLEDGVDPKAIAEIVELSERTVLRYKKEYEDSVTEQGHNDMAESRKDNSVSDKKNDKKTEKKDEKKEKPTGFDDDAILQGTEQKAVTIIQKKLSEQVSAEYLNRVYSGSVLYKMEQEYRESVEAMGYEWDYFMEKSFELLYDITLEDYLKQQSMVTIDDVLSMNMANKLAKGSYDDGNLKEVQEVETYGR